MKRYLVIGVLGYAVWKLAVQQQEQRQATLNAMHAEGLKLKSEYMLLWEESKTIPLMEHDWYRSLVVNGFRDDYADWQERWSAWSQAVKEL